MSDLKIDFKASPNHSSRNGVPIEYILLHATVGSYASSLAWLRNPQPLHPDDRVSTHYLIRKNGAITQLVADDRAAWHAGRGRWLGRSDLNERSIGVELENANDGRDPYPAAQLASARDLCKALIARYSIARAGIARHLDTATPKGRKTDPANFPWPSFADSLYAADPAPTCNAAQYRVRRLMISTKSTGGPPYAGEITPGSFVEIDATYPSGQAHLKNNLGFVLLSDLIPAGGE